MAVEPPAADPEAYFSGEVLAEFPPGPPSGVSLDLSASALPPYAAGPTNPVSAVFGATAQGQRASPAPQSGLRVNAGIGFAVPDNPPVSVSADLIGRAPSSRAPVRVSNERPFGTEADMRTPRREAASEWSTPYPPAVGLWSPWTPGST